MEAGGKGVRDVLPRLPMDVDDEVHLVRIAVAVGDAELAEHAAGAAGERSERNPGLPTLEAVAMHARALSVEARQTLREP